MTILASALCGWTKGKGGQYNDSSFLSFFLLRQLSAKDKTTKKGGQAERQQAAQGRRTGASVHSSAGRRTRLGRFATVRRSSRHGWTSRPESPAMGSTSSPATLRHGNCTCAGRRRQPPEQEATTHLQGNRWYVRRRQLFLRQQNKQQQQKSKKQKKRKRLATGRRSHQWRIWPKVASATRASCVLLILSFSFP